MLVQWWRYGQRKGYVVVLEGGVSRGHCGGWDESGHYGHYGKDVGDEHCGRDVNGHCVCGEVVHYGGGGGGDDWEDGEEDEWH